MATISGLSQIIPGYVLGALFARRGRHAGLLARLAGLMLTWQERANQRHALARMDDHTLADVGLTRIDVAAELRKGFWQR